MAQPASIHWRLAQPNEPLLRFLSRGEWMASAAIVKSNDRRTVYRVQAGDAASSPLFIKHDHPRRWHDRLKSLWRSKTRIEFDAGTALAAAKVPCVPVLAWGSRGSEGWLVTRQVPGAVKFWRAWRACAGDAKRRGFFMRGWAQLLRRLSRAGVVHTDLHRGNILVRPSRGGARFLLVDLYDARVSVHQPADLLRGVMSSLGPMVRLLGDDELDALLAAAGAGRWSRHPRAVWRDVLAPTSARFAKHRGKREAKLLGDGRLCRRVRREEGTWLLRRPFPIELAEQAVAEHRGLRSQGSAAMQHDDETRRGTRVPVGGHTLIVHELRRGATGESAARLRWCRGYAVFGPGLHVARHYAWLAAADADYLICEDMGSRTLHDVLRSDAADAAHVLAAAGAMLARIHSIGIAWPLSASQVIVRDRPANALHQLGQIHAGAAMVLARIDDARRAADLRSLVASFPSTVSSRLKARFFAGYRRWSGLTRAAMRALIHED